MSDNISPAQFQLLVDQIAALQSEIKTLCSAQQTPSTSSSNPSTVSVQQLKEPKISMPEEFHGNKKKAQNFIYQCQTVFLAQQARYRTDTEKILFAISYLKSAAFDWVSPYMKESRYTTEFPTFSVFEEKFLAIFGDPNQKRLAENKLMNLRQGNRPCSYLVSEFQRLLLEAGWSEKAPSVFEIFYKTLNEDVKDEISRFDRPETISEYFNLAVKIDNRIFERKQEKQNSSASNRPKTTFNSSNRSPRSGKSHTNHLKPFMTNNVAATRGKLTDEEKERRKKEGLCIYCGESGHLLKDCDQRKGRNSAASSSTRSENSKAQH